MDLPVRVNICVCHNSSAEVPEAIENEEQVKGLYSSGPQGNCRFNP